MRVILFNLVPYRQQQHQKRKVKFWSQAGLVAAIAVVLCFLITIDLSDRVDAKVAFLSKVDNMQGQIANQASAAEALQWEKEDLEKRIAVLESVDRTSIHQSTVFSVLDRSRPNTVSLATMRMRDDTLTLRGLTSDLPALSRWVSLLEEDSELFRSVSIVRVTGAKSSRSSAGALSEQIENQLHDFQLSMELQPVSKALTVTESK